MIEIEKIIKNIKNPLASGNTVTDYDRFIIDVIKDIKRYEKALRKYSPDVKGVKVFINKADDKKSIIYKFYSCKQEQWTETDFSKTIESDVLPTSIRDELDGNDEFEITDELIEQIFA